MQKCRDEYDSLNSPEVSEITDIFICGFLLDLLSLGDVDDVQLLLGGRKIGGTEPHAQSGVILQDVVLREEVAFWSTFLRASSWC